VNLTIVGLRTTGTLIGLALKAATSEIPIVGHDPDPVRTRRASRLGAIDKSHWNLISACSKADMILLDLPLDELETTLAALDKELGENVVLIDTCPVKRPVMEIAERTLNHHTQFVGGHLVARAPQMGESELSPDMTKGAAFYLVALPDTSPQALDMTTNLAVAIGAKPQFVDAVEHDGLVAATSQLVLLSALALADTLTDSHGERDRQQGVGSEYAALGSILNNTQVSSSELLANRDNLIRWFDALAEHWSTWRETLTIEAGGKLADEIERVTEISERWMRSREETPEAEPALSWRDMLLGRRKRQKR